MVEDYTILLTLLADPIFAFIFALLIIAQCKFMISDCVMLLMVASPKSDIID